MTSELNSLPCRPEFILSVCSLAGHEKWADSADKMFDTASKDGQVSQALSLLVRKSTNDHEPGTGQPGPLLIG